VYVSTAVVDELYYGAYASSNPQRHVKQIQSFLDNCTILESNITTAIVYGQTKSDLKKKGTPIPENDIFGLPPQLLKIKFRYLLQISTLT